MAKRAPKDDTAKASIVARLRSAQGHMRSIVDMVEADAYCIEVLQQTTAVRAALVKVEGLLLARHLHHCVSTTLASGSQRERKLALEEVLEVFAAGRR